MFNHLFPKRGQGFLVFGQCDPVFKLVRIFPQIQQLSSVFPALLYVDILISPVRDSQIPLSLRKGKIGRASCRERVLRLV